jgi:putative membrane protein
MHFKKFVVSFGLAGSLALAPTAALAADPSTHDIAFLKAAHQTNLAVILGGQVAWKKTTDPAVKKLAATLMRDHIHLDAALAETARGLSVRLPIEPTAEQQAITARYEAVAPSAIDDLYISTQQTLIREAGVLASTQAAKGSDPAVKNVAAKASPILSGHQELLRKAANSERIAG